MAEQKLLGKICFHTTRDGRLKSSGGTIPAGHQGVLYCLDLVKKLDARVSELERLTLPTDSEAGGELEYEDFVEAPPVPEPVKLSTESLAELNKLQEELSFCAREEERLKKVEVDDDIESVSSEGTVCTQRAHEIIKQKLEAEGAGVTIQPWHIEDDCSGCVKKKAKTVKAQRKQEKKKIREAKKEISQAKTQAIRDEIIRINDAIKAVNTGSA